jgi:hypothetical protein
VKRLHASFGSITTEDETGDQAVTGARAARVSVKLSDFRGAQRRLSMHVRALNMRLHLDKRRVEGS